MSKKMLIVEDEASIRSLLNYDFKNLGFDITLCEDGAQAMKAIEQDSFDIILLDWMLPYYSGLELAKAFRDMGVDAIIFMITAKDDESDILDAFEAGVDDYITKPFSPRQLGARVQAHLRRTSKKDKHVVLKHADVEMNLDKRQVHINDEKLDLTKTEFELLKLLLENFESVLSRDFILDQIWNFDYDGDTRIVDVHVFKLRSKIEGSMLEIGSERGVGYVAQRK